MIKNIFSIIFLVAAVMIFLLWTKPEIEEIKKLMEEKAVLNENLARIDEFEESLSKILDRFNSINEGKIQRLEEFLPSTADSIELIIEVEKLVKESGLTLKNINAVPIKEIKNIKGENNSGVLAVPISMTVEGKYDNFILFLESLEKNLRLIDVNGINFTSTENGVYTYSINAAAYYYGN